MGNIYSFRNITRRENNKKKIDVRETGDIHDDCCYRKFNDLEKGEKIIIFEYIIEINDWKDTDLINTTCQNSTIPSYNYQNKKLTEHI